MAIVINGDGTVTGIAVGGIPDGIVTGSKLAASAVGRSNIGYSGVPLQTVFNNSYTTMTSVTSTSFTDSGISLSITSVKASSKFLVEPVLALNLNNDRLKLRMMRIISGAETQIKTDRSGYYIIQTSGATDREFHVPYFHVDEPNVAAGTTITYRIDMLSAGGGLVRVNDNLYSAFKITEISA